MKIYKSIVAIPPGETIREELDALNMSQSDFAKRMDMSEKTISQIINGDAPITYDTALNLESVLGVSATFWNNYEAKYRENLKRIEEAKKLESEQSILENIPYREMIKKGWIEKGDDKIELSRNLKHFFRVSALDILPNTESELFSFYSNLKIQSNSTPHEVTLFKKSISKEICKYSMATWIRKAENDAVSINTSIFSKDKVNDSIPEMKKLSLENSQESLNALKEICRQCGIALVIVPHLKKTYVDGMAKWLGKDKALIALSCRGKKWDSFWFNFFHELAHIMKHRKKELFINAEETSMLEIEEEANNIAKNLLLSNLDFKSISKVPTKDNILSLSAKLQIHPSIIVGRLQFENVIPYTFLNEMKEQIHFLSEN